MSSINSINNYNENILNSFLNSNEKDNLNGFGTSIQGESILNSVSTMGKQINDIYATLKESNNEDAISGFKTALNTLGSNIDDYNSIDFLNLANDLSKNDQETLNNLFTTIEKLDDNGLSNNVYGFINTVNNYEKSLGRENLNDFLNTTSNLTDKFENEDALKSASTLNDYLKMVNTISNIKDENINKEEVYKTFTNGINERNDLESINKYVKNFNKDNQYF